MDSVPGHTSIFQCFPYHDGTAKLPKGVLGVLGTQGRACEQGAECDQELQSQHNEPHQPMDILLSCQMLLTDPTPPPRVRGITRLS